MEKKTDRLTGPDRVIIPPNPLPTSQHTLFKHALTSDTEQNPDYRRTVFATFLAMAEPQSSPRQENLQNKCTGTEEREVGKKRKSS